MTNNRKTQTHVNTLTVFCVMQILIYEVTTLQKVIQKRETYGFESASEIICHDYNYFST